MSSKARSGSMDPNKTEDTASNTESVELDTDVEVEDVVEQAESQDENEDMAAPESVDEFDADVTTLESLDPTEEIWEGGPTAGQALAWKQQYGDIYVSKVDPYQEKYVLWRPLNRHEYRNLIKIMENSIAQGLAQSEANMNNEEGIAETCCLFPKYVRQSPASYSAGIATNIASEVMENSGFVSTEVRKL